MINYKEIVEDYLKRHHNGYELITFSSDPEFLDSVKNYTNYYKYVFNNNYSSIETKRYIIHNIHANDFYKLNNLHLLPEEDIMYICNIPNIDSSIIQKIVNKTIDDNLLNKLSLFMSMHSLYFAFIQNQNTNSDILNKIDLSYLLKYNYNEYIYKLAKHKNADDSLLNKLLDLKDAHIASSIASRLMFHLNLSKEIQLKIAKTRYADARVYLAQRAIDIDVLNELSRSINYRIAYELIHNKNVTKDILKLIFNKLNHYNDIKEICIDKLSKLKNLETFV